MLKIYITGMVPIEEKKLRDRIEKQFEGAEYRGEVVLRVVNDFVFDSEWDSQPYFFLRVYLIGDAAKDSEDIERRLEVLNMDMEILDLRKVVHVKK